MSKFNINYKLLTREQLLKIESIKAEYDEMLSELQKRRKESSKMYEIAEKAIEDSLNDEIIEYLKSIKESK